MMPVYINIINVKFIRFAAIILQFRHRWSGFSLVKLVPVLLLLLLPLYGSAATFTAKKDGNWSDPATWTPGTGATTTIPGSGDIVVIPGNKVVTVNVTNAVCNSVILESDNPKAELVINGVLQVATIKQFETSGNGQANGKIGKLTINSGGTLKISDKVDLDGRSTWLNYAFAPNSTVEYNGTATSQLIEKSFIYKNLVLSGSSNSLVTGPFEKVVDGGLTVAENFTISSTANFKADAYTHSIGGHWINNGNFTSGASTVNLSGAATQQIKGSSITAFNNLHLSGVGVKESQQNFSVAGNFVINLGSTFDAKTYTHTIGGSWANDGAFTAGTSTIVFNGTAPQQIGGTVLTTFYNLTSSGTKGTTLASNITVTNNLSISNSNLNTGTGPRLMDYYLITLAPTASLTGEADNAYVNGRIATQRWVTASGASFGGIGFYLASSSINPGEIKVERVTGFTRSGNGNQSVPRYYEVKYVSGDQTNLNLKMDFSFLNRELTGIITDYDMVREVVDGDFDNVKSITSPSRPLSVQNTDKGVFGRYTLSSKNFPLPVDLVWFKAEARGSAALLTWQTAWERENAGFAVQLSEDGEEFRQVGFVQEGSATKNGAQSYSFVHEDYHKSGTRYYRLAQHDLDGTVTYSPVRVVEIRSEGQLVAYPNPFTDELTVVLPTDQLCRLYLTNHLGEKVYSATTTTLEHTIRPGSSLKRGIYFLTVDTGSAIYTRKLIKQ
ncbi:T9SS type A sorting domain-containing protein [Pontibacter sp. MBLB2868]|uniref:T9SS type A sorting domain-containing protein n=1 Tax=Pontibacter sp. MBLB2868 TaxID=3451555 RepID=UPI003F74F3F9